MLRKCILCANELLLVAQALKKLSEAEFLEFSSGLDRRRINFDRGSLKGFIGDAGMNRDGGVTL